jgi:peptidyl-prolyl cis-trans isomerase SurA
VTITRRPAVILIALLLSTAAAACGGSGAPAAAGDDVWAVVNARQIGKAEVEKAYSRLKPQATAQPTPDEELAAKFSLLDEMITQALLAQRAAALKIEVTDAEIETAYSDRKRNMTEEAFQAELKQRGLSADDLKRSLRDELLANRVLDREVLAKIAVSDAEVSDFYQRNRQQFNVAETQYRIAQLVITPQADPQLRNRLGDDAKTPEEAARKAQMLMEKLKGGAQFSQLAADYSEDPQSAPQGGDLGYISASQLAKLPPALRDAVLKTEPGTVRTLSAGGAHTLVLVAAREDAGQRELTAPSVRDGITNTLRERKVELLRAAYITSLRDSADLVNYLARRIADGSVKPATPTLVLPAAPGK